MIEGEAFICPLPRKRFSVSPRRIKSVLCSRFSFALLGLAFCVFTWGLQYKLSLYDPPQSISREIPHAKLISKDQRNHPSEGLALRNEGGSDKAAAVAPFSLLFVLILLLDAAFHLERFGRYSAGKEPVRSPGHTDLNFFFFRPPPVLC